MRKRRQSVTPQDIEPFQPIDAIRPPHTEGGAAETNLPPLDESKVGLVSEAPHVEIPECEPPRD